MKTLSILVIGIFCAGCGRAGDPSPKQSAAPAQVAQEVPVAAPKPEIGKPREARKVELVTVTGKVANGELDYLTAAGRFDADLTKKDTLPLQVDGTSLELRASQVKRIEVTRLVPNGPSTYGWAAAEVTVTTTDNQKVVGRCSPDLYVHVIVPESFAMSSLQGLFKRSDDTGSPLLRFSPAELKEIDGKKLLAVPLNQIASITLD
jgi:hypothetical protein